MFLCVVLGLNHCLNQSGEVFYVGQVTPSIFVGESPLSTLWNVPDSYAASPYFVLVITTPPLYFQQVCRLVAELLFCLFLLQYRRMDYYM
jgi:hypothetical protein